MCLDLLLGTLLLRCARLGQGVEGVALTVGAVVLVPVVAAALGAAGASGLRSSRLAATLL